MRVNKYMDLFNKKGYCIVREIDTRFDRDDFINSQQKLISQIENILGSINYEKISFFNDDSEDNLYPYIIYFDTSRVEIKIIRNLKTYVEEILI